MGAMASTRRLGPDWVKLFESFGAVGLRAEKVSELDDVLKAMINENRPVIADVKVDEKENCFPMIPSGAPHNQILLGDNSKEIPAMAFEDMAAGAF